MVSINSISNTHYIRSLSAIDLKSLQEAFDQWPEEQQNEFIGRILEMEGGYDGKMDEEVKKNAKTLERAVDLIKKGETAARHMDEESEQTQSLKKAEAALREL